MSGEENLQLQSANELIVQASTIVAAYVSRNPISTSEIPSMIRSIHGALAGLSHPSSDTTVTMQKPAVSIKKSITPEFVICLEDGKKLKMLKRYLRSRYGLSPEQYRTKWGLPADYPMTAPNYAELRSQFAKKIGLGRKARTPKKRKRA